MSFDLKRTIALITALACMGLCACNEKSSSDSALTESGETADSSSSASGEGVLASEVINTSEIFTDRDLEGSYDESEAVAISLNGDSGGCSDSSVSIDGGNITITKEGIYILSGSLTGSIIVETDKEEKVQLVLDNAEISAQNTAAIYVKQADKVFVTLKEGTENSLTSSGEFASDGDNNIDGVIFSKDDLVINGEGALEISTESGNGVVSKDDLKLISGNISAEVSNHAFEGKDSIVINGGSYKVTSGKDGFHAENSDDSSLGYIYIANGSFEVISGGDCFDASCAMQIESGEFNLTSGGGAQNAEAHIEQWGGGMGGRGGFENTATTAATTTDTEESSSTKALKADGEITISGGSFTIDACDDAVHSNTSISVFAGDFAIKTGDDGFHSDGTTSISGGTISISESYEGVEGLDIYISGGEIDIISSDDGLNAAGGNDESGYGGFGNDIFAVNEDCVIEISGGIININAGGDGIDSNGNLVVTGGETYVAGPSDSGNGALDFAGNAEISGGIFVATGMSGMAQNFSTATNQGVMMINISQSVSDEIVLYDASGNELLSFDPEKSYNSVVISCPDIVVGESYSVSMSGTTTEVTMDSSIYGSSGMMGGGQGGQMGTPGEQGEQMGTPGEQGGQMGRPEGQMGRPEGQMGGNADMSAPDGETPPEMPSGEMGAVEGQTPPEMPTTSGSDDSSASL